MAALSLRELRREPLVQRNAAQACSALPDCAKNLVDFGDRKRFGDDAQTDEIRLMKCYLIDE